MFEGPKIVCPQRSNLNTFGYSDGSWYASADVYFIKESDNRFPLKCILGILNSKLYFYWLYHRGKRKGEMLELYQVPLSEIPLPNLSKQVIKELSSLVDSCVDLAAKGESLLQVESNLNNFIYELFELTALEVELIESSYMSAQKRRRNTNDLDELSD